MPTSTGDDDLIAALKPSLRGGGGLEPKDQYVRLAAVQSTAPFIVWYMNV